MPSPLHAGLLRTRVTLQRLSVVQDAAGQVSGQSFGDYGDDVYVNMTGKVGQQLEMAQASATGAIAQYAVRMRFRDDVRPGGNRMKIDAGGGRCRYFQINSVFDPDGRRRELQMVVTEIVA